MSSDLERKIQEKIQALPESKQRDVLGLVEGFLRESQAEPRTSVRPIWEIFEELSGQIPPGEWSRLPV